MKLAYFVNQYPKVSHSFIRREILALERLGYSVERFALRTDKDELVDPLDQSELPKTRYILAEQPLKIASAFIKTFCSSPQLFFKSLKVAIRLGLRSDRGLIRHLIYLIEACVLLQWEKAAGIEHIHAHFGTNSTAVVMLAQLLGGVGYSFTVHGPEEFDKPEFIHLAEKIHHSRFVVAISSYGRSQLFRWLPASEWHKVKIVRCGLDAAFLSQKATKIPEASRQLLCIGRLCEQKGQLLLLDAMKQLHDEGVNCKLILAGDGPMRNDVENRIAAYQLDNVVEITGWISSEQVKSLLIASRGMVLPSFAEGLPVVIMEALALRRPVISTYVAGIPELIQHGKNGWLVPPGDVGSLKTAMQELLNTSDADLETMGEQGFNAVFAQHDIEKEAGKLAALFTEAVI
ncbi:glycosyltransferase family 4 protein [Methyloglobulus sp.]|uniref:glycosyltransferase family 4 protein n=1 Tax=Methyloglobulus sp. TaxID=2518622 RepID=UPI0032B7AEE0